MTEIVSLRCVQGKGTSVNTASDDLDQSICCRLIVSLEPVKYIKPLRKHAYSNSQTCLKQPPMGSLKCGC